MANPARHDGRRSDELRPLRIRRRYLRTVPGSVLIEAGGTRVLCTATISDDLPKWREAAGQGWLTAEYNMLPASTTPRKQRERGGKLDGRTAEIQRLIGRSLRAVMDFAALGPRTMTVDCDVLEADGGTRTASVTGSFVALVDALHALPDGAALARSALTGSVAAVSVGIVAGRPLLDLDYREDVAAAVDMNVVMTGAGRFVELQSTGEEDTFSEKELAAMLKLARGGIAELAAAQAKALGKARPR
ncbi:MAG: ribonuclease PH [Pirellulales bacterium]|nr:ribonuclease PH [Pirellulales bacterium]